MVAWIACRRRTGTPISPRTDGRGQGRAFARAPSKSPSQSHQRKISAAWARTAMRPSPSGTSACSESSLYVAFIIIRLACSPPRQRRSRSRYPATMRTPRYLIFTIVLLSAQRCPRIPPMRTLRPHPSGVPRPASSPTDGPFLGRPPPPQAAPHRASMSMRPRVCRF